MKRLFFSQSMLDSMVEAGRIRVEKGILTMLTPGEPTYDLVPAYRFVRTIDNKPDPAGLVGTVRSEAELKGMGAEIYMDSIIHQDIAYQADPGFICERTAPAAQPSAAGAAEQPKEDDQLSKFILDNLL